MSTSDEKTTVEIDGHHLTLSNLEKDLYETGFKKRDVLDYYARVAPAMLKHLKDRPVTVKRFPDGTTKGGFVGKNAPANAPGWLKTATLERKGTGWGQKDRDDGPETTTYPLVGDLASLTFLVNLAAIELHTPMWRLRRDGTKAPPDLVVFDLDPGEPATITHCCQVALRLQERMAKDGIELLAKTSGSKGLQCYGRIAAKRSAEGGSNELAHEIAEELERSDPAHVVSKMKKDLRSGKVLIDWSQNNVNKTTVTAYSLRGLRKPSVSTPVSWDEVAACTERKNKLSFGPDEVLARLEEIGDLFEPLVS